MAERGLKIDHSTLNRWVVHYAPKLKKTFHKKKNRRVKIRQSKYLNNIVEQDRRRIKRVTRLMLGLNNVHSALATLVGIELFATEPYRFITSVSSLAILDSCSPTSDSSSID